MKRADSNRYRVALGCDDIPVDMGLKAATDISEEFAHRTWHENVECKWSNGSLLLSAENDFDVQGLALMHEFSDAISACTAVDFDYGIRLVSVTVL